MAQTGRFNIEKRGIARLLEDSNLVIPQYQRSYAWEAHNVTEFLDDVVEACKRERPEYFLGSIVIAQNSEANQAPDVVDGQQRLATATILVAQIRDHFKQLQDTRNQDIDARFLMNRDLRSKEDVQKLQLNERDNDFFLKAVLRPGGKITPQRGSHRAIAEAKEICKKRVQDLAAQPNGTDLLIDLLVYLQNKAQVIVLTVPSDENAFVLFETLNDRGLDLALSDLLKNYLFRVAGNRLREVQNSWTAMYSFFEASNTEGDVVDFIRQTWSATRSLIREKDLFGAIKGTVTGKQNAVEFSEELRQYATLFQALLSPSHPFWKDHRPSAARHLETLNFLGLTRLRPLLLAILRSLPADQVAVSLRRAVSWAVRLTVSGNIGSGSVEEAFCQRAREIKDEKIVNADALSSAIETVIPTDAAFQDTFQAFSTAKSKLARYIIGALERAAGGEQEPELVVNTDPTEMTLEHVLPQHPGSKWPGITDEVAAVYRYRLGNMVLLRRTENESLGNDDFKSKQPALQASSLKLTKEVGAERDWDANKIRARQQRLSEHALAAWPLR